mgnify:CR=1 FL=1
MINLCLKSLALHQPHVTLDHVYDNSLKGLFLGVDWAFFKVCSTFLYVNIDFLILVIHL